MSRIEENTEMRKRTVELSETARTVATEKIDGLCFNSRIICEIMMDISKSLAVIADKLTEKSEEDTDQKSLDEWTVGEEKRWESEEEE